jgi:hypothetical protein
MRLLGRPVRKTLIAAIMDPLSISLFFSHDITIIRSYCHPQMVGWVFILMISDIKVLMLKVKIFLSSNGTITNKILILKPSIHKTINLFQPRTSRHT